MQLTFEEAQLFSRYAEWEVVERYTGRDNAMKYILEEFVLAFLNKEPTYIPEGGVVKFLIPKNLMEGICSYGELPLITLFYDVFADNGNLTILFQEWEIRKIEE